MVGRECAQDLDEPLRERLRRADGMVGHFEFAPAFALSARRFGRERGLKEQTRLGGRFLSEIGCGLECWHELALGRRDEIGRFAYIMNKAEARGVEFTFLWMEIFLPLSVPVVRMFGLDVFADAKERIELFDCRGRKTMIANEFEGLRMSLAEKGENVLKQKGEVVHNFFPVGIDF